MKLGVISPFYNRWELTHKQMLKFFHFLPDWCEIYLVNDASTEDCDGGVAWWQKEVSRNKVYYLKNKVNLGFGGSMNRGAKAAIKNGCDAIVLISNDVEIFGDFAIQVKEQLEESNKLLIGGEVLYNNTGWNVLPDCITVPYANGWFLACTAEAWKDIGGFDPLYEKFDYEDVCLSLTAQMKGYTLSALKNPNVLRHLGGQTIQSLGIDRQKITRENQKKFIEKWSKVPCEEIKEKVYGVKPNA